MEIDVKINTETAGFKFRVCGIIILDNKVLLQKINNNKFYCLPGGNVELLEDTEQAILRELNEETKLDYNIKALISINENFFKHEGKDYHELGYYYLVEPKKNEDISKDNFEILENDKEKIKDLSFEWVELKNLSNVDFRPSFLKEKIANNNFKFEHIITKEK